MPAWTLAGFLDAYGLLPHGICLTWRPELLWLHAVSDAVTALAYYSIPVALLVFAWRRRDLQFRWMFVLFGIFITACGTTHVMGLLTLWVPLYAEEGLVKAVTALSSILTTAVLFPLIPKALALPGPAQWEAVNRDLHDEVSERREAEAEVRRLNAELERRVAERTAELAAANAELRTEVETRQRAENEVAQLNAALELRVQQRTAELEAANQRLEGITNNLFEGVLLVDDGGLVAFANPSAHRLLRDGDLRMEGQAVDGVFRVRHQGREIAFADSPLAAIAREGQMVCDHDAQIVTSCGKVVDVACACSPLKERTGLQGTIISIRDIQVQKAAQRDAAQASRLASVGQLAAGIAHEINTPAQYVGDNIRFCGNALTKLIPLLGAVEALLRSSANDENLTDGARRIVDAAGDADLGYLREEVPQALRDALEGVRQIARIVLSMKEFAHPGGSGMMMADINRAIENTLVVSHNSWKHAAVVETDLAAGLPPLPCHLPEINQVLLNLVTNAVDAIEASGKPLPGRITVSTRETADGVVIRVEDNGIGVPEPLRDRIFDPFFTTKPVGKGTGQGLAISRDIVVGKHRGRLEVGGKDGVGAVFTVWIPWGDDPS
ncbi:MAG: hypothetical protein HYU60_05555 [Magnetospirillum sp.]|nr:hypothetical protein [Magnetospirillum sp.]